MSSLSHLKLRSPIAYEYFKEKEYVLDFYSNQLFQVVGGNLQPLNLQPLSLKYPTDISSNQSYLLISDTYNHRVLILDKELRLVQELSKKKYGLNVPSSAVIYQNSIFIADSGNHRVLQISLSNYLVKNSYGFKKTKLHSPTKLKVIGDKLYLMHTAEDSILQFQES